MSTDAPLPSADLPSTSTTSTSELASSWSQYGTGNNVGAELMSLRKRRVGEVVQSLEQKSPQTIDATEDNASEVNTIGAEGGDGEDRTNAPSSSPTAYAFSGSALVSDGVANLKEKLPNTNPTSQTKSDENNSNNASTSNESNANNNEDRQDESMYECNICLDTAKDAVVSMCGHLFCWPCLHQWLETRPNRMLCPVCKAAISKDKVIPLYGRNSAKQEDPRNKVPPRPAGQRTEPEPQTAFQGFGFGDGFHMSFGIGAFPFGYFASSFNIGEPRPGPANRGAPHYEDEQQLSKLFMYLAFLCIGWLLFA